MKNARVRFVNLSNSAKHGQNEEWVNAAVNTKDSKTDDLKYAWKGAWITKWI